ncbi:MAG: hypothetical protein DLM63_02465 [Solirubrobacterales bacterium]|nr:MAG: hypothetical protein DLM63_02465 [Solirubrobacterales bacterium]
MVAAVGGSVERRAERGIGTDTQLRVVAGRVYRGRHAVEGRGDVADPFRAVADGAAENVRGVVPDALGPDRPCLGGDRRRVLILDHERRVVDV